jgi:hypothetical protein
MAPYTLYDHLFAIALGIATIRRKLTDCSTTGPPQFLGGQAFMISSKVALSLS